MDVSGTSAEDVRAFLATSTFFGCFADDALARLVAAGVRRRFPRGHVLVDQGSPGDSLLVMLGGTAKIVRVGADGREVVLNFLARGDLLGEIAVLDGGERTARAEVLEPAEVFVIRRSDILPALAAEPEALLEIVAVLCEKLRATSAIVESHGHEMTRRVAAGLLRLAELHGRRRGGRIEIELGATQEDLGSYLGLSRANTSRQIAGLARSGMIASEGRRLVVLDLDGLRSLAEADGE